MNTVLHCLLDQRANRLDDANRLCTGNKAKRTHCGQASVDVADARAGS